jgi:hypothetical protein
MILAWLLLLTGLIISAVAIYYSVVGLTAIFSAAVIPIIVMGSALEVGKLVCASWLKANWERAPAYMKYYMISAVVILMLITSMGIFGFLSKAHNDQNLVSGDVQSKIAIYDEKIKTEKENIDANRKVLKQLDESVDQVMGRSQDEKGAEKAVAIRKSQQKERGRIAQDITESQKRIASLNEERAPIAAEVRKVEAEVGPIKYIAKFIYGDQGADENSLERAVTWIIILIVIVFDPLAVIMLLAAQMTFGWNKKQEEDSGLLHKTVPHTETPVQEDNFKFLAEDKDLYPEQTPTAQFVDNGEHPKDTYEHEHTEKEIPSETPPTALGGDITAPEPLKDEDHLDNWNKMIAEAEKETLIQEEARKYQVLPELQEELEKADGRIKPDLTEVVEPEFSKKKTYMTKDSVGKIQVKNRS